jgi:putative FmdB family regulatory protein
MPIYEYECRGCGHRFEALVRETAPPCPECQGTDLQRLLSMFAVSSDSTGARC